MSQRIKLISNDIPTLYFKMWEGIMKPMFTLVTNARKYTDDDINQDIKFLEEVGFKVERELIK